MAGSHPRPPPPNFFFGRSFFPFSLVVRRVLNEYVWLLLAAAAAVPAADGAFDVVRSPLRAIRVIRQLDMIMQTVTDFCMSPF